MFRRNFVIGLLTSIATGFAIAPDIASAGHDRRGGGGRKSFYQDNKGQNRARRALNAGNVLPLGKIMGMLSRRFPGKVLDANLVRDGRRYVYYLKVLDSQGRVAEVKVDAQSGRVLGVRGRKR